jgi:exodeoxyribonuclease III
MLIATFNCNSVRARLDAVLAWLESHAPDVLALQETKCADEQFPLAAFEDAGWRVAFRGEKRYNGVAMVTREEPQEVSFGLGDDDGESETRLALLRLGDVWVLNTYVPQGSALETDRFEFKLNWFARVRSLLERRFDSATDRLVWVGDLNVAPTPADVYDSKGLWPNVCHCQEVIDAFQQVLDWGLEDVFRKHLPDEGIFTFWDYRMPKGLQRNLGWRLDHVLATAPAALASEECVVDLEPRRGERPSDHTFVAAKFAF